MKSLSTLFSLLRLLILLSLLASGMVACNDSPTPPTVPPPPPPPSRASVAIALNPQTIDAAFLEKEALPWKAEWVVRIRESAGVGGHIDFVRATLSDAGSGSFAVVELGAGEISAQLGTNHLSGRTQQDVSMSLAFEWPPHVVSGELLVESQFTDDLTNVSAATATSRVQICVPALLEPPEGAVLDNSCEKDKGDNGLLWEFEWADCPGADVYEVFIMLTGTPRPSFNRDNLTSSSFTVLSETLIQEPQRFGWFWRVRSRYDDLWSDWSPERMFVVEPLNTDCINP